MAQVQAVGRYHTNDSGQTLPCTAGVRQCRFVHGDSPEESASNWQQTMDQDLFPRVQRPEPKDVKLARLRLTSLKDMDDRDLAETILLEVESMDLDVAKVSEAIALASDLHGKQFRKGNRGSVTNPPYIEHPLRNTLRIIRLGCAEESVISGSVLHDTVEDTADVFVKRQGWSNRQAQDEHAARAVLTDHIEKTFGSETREIVIAVTNEIPDRDPRTMSTEEKHAIYVQHLRDQVLHSPKAYMVKISDFIDNATGLYHGVGSIDPEKLKKQATKYLLSVPAFLEGHRNLDLPIPAHSKQLLRDSLIETERRLRKIIDGWDGTGRI